MDLLKQVLNWTAEIAWPAAVLAIALLYRKPIYALLSNIGGIAGRAVTQPFELSLGEKFRIAFREVVSAKAPKTVDEAISVAAEIADESITVYRLFRDVSLTESQRDIDYLRRNHLPSDESLHPPKNHYCSQLLRVNLSGKRLIWQRYWH